MSSFYGNKVVSLLPEPASVGNKKYSGLVKRFKFISNDVGSEGCSLLLKNLEVS
jgi:hypothetical protein